MIICCVEWEVTWPLILNWITLTERLWSVAFLRIAGIGVSFFLAASPGLHILRGSLTVRALTCNESHLVAVRNPSCFLNSKRPLYGFQARRLGRTGEAAYRKDV